MQLRWKENNTPESSDFDDIYFAVENGLEESRYVFFEQNHLNERWTGQRNFHIGETGFGTGLNFFATWQKWKEHPQRPKTLYFTSCEKFPLSKDQISRAISRWPELKTLSDELLEIYEPYGSGFYRYRLNGGQVILTLMIGDIAETWPEQEGLVDAWYFDGFAPKKNPEMWQDEVFKEAARLSYSETTFSTFTCVGEIKRRFIAHGFKPEKFAGFGKKREMLRGEFVSETKIFSPKRRSVAIIGGGLAGCFLAKRLSEDFDIRLFERNPSLADEASGNKKGIVLPTITADRSAIGLLSLESFHLARQDLSAVGGGTYETVGGLRLIQDERSELRIHKALASGFYGDTFMRKVSAIEASEIAGLKIEKPCLYFPQAAITEPVTTCLNAVEHLKGDVFLKSPVSSIHERGGGWELRSPDKNTLGSFDCVIIANAIWAKDFASLAIEELKGQVYHLPTTAQLEKLKTILYFESYLTPARESTHMLGATFQKEFDSSKEEAKANLQLVQKLQQNFPYLENLDAQSGAARARVRAAPSSRMAYISETDRKGVFVCTGFGSKGLSYAPYGAEVLYSRLTKTPAPLERTLYECLDFQETKYYDPYERSPNHGH